MRAPLMGPAWWGLLQPLLSHIAAPVEALRPGTRSGKAPSEEGPAAGAGAGPDSGRSPPRIALLKFQRTASTFVMEKLKEAACQQWECEGHWVHEVLNEPCGEDRDEAPPACAQEAALSRIRAFTGCEGGRTSCGWSLNLLKHGRMGMKIWEQLVEELVKQPTFVIFLTRDNVAAQHISWKIADKRRKVMHSDAYTLQGFRRCNPFQITRCNPEAQEWIDQRAGLQLDLPDLTHSVMSNLKGNKKYRRLEENLRHRNLFNITVLHLTYEQLFVEGTWRTLLDTLGLTMASPPAMRERTSYRRYIENWDQVAREIQSLGYSSEGI